MLVYDKIYKIISFINFLIHILLCVFIIIVGFLPFRETQNFYEVFTGFFGEELSELHPYFILSILFSACAFAFFAIKRPLFSILTLILSFFCFVIIEFPYSFEAAFVEFTSKWIASSMSNYGIGFTLIGYASYVIYFEFAFAMYSLAIWLIRHKRTFLLDLAEEHN